MLLLNDISFFAALNHVNFQINLFSSFLAYIIIYKDWFYLITLLPLRRVTFLRQTIAVNRYVKHNLYYTYIEPYLRGAVRILCWVIHYFYCAYFNDLYFSSYSISKESQDTRQHISCCGTINLCFHIWNYDSTEIK